MILRIEKGDDTYHGYVSGTSSRGYRIDNSTVAFAPEHGPQWLDNSIFVLVTYILAFFFLCTICKIAYGVATVSQQAPSGHASSTCKHLPSAQ